MKAILTLLCLLFCVEAYAGLTTYSVVRDYVERHNPNNQTPATNRIFITFERKDSAIVPYHDGMKLDDAIKQSKLKEKDVFIFVFRRAGEHPGDSILVYATQDWKNIKSSDFALHPLDAIHLVDFKNPIN
jgi:hypothetical protein